MSDTFGHVDAASLIELQEEDSMHAGRTGLHAGPVMDNTAAGDTVRRIGTSAPTQTQGVAAGAGVVVHA